MRVWVDQDLCTGDGLCVDHCPEVFVLLEDGISYVHDGEWLGRVRRCWRVLDDRNGLSVAAMKARKGHDDSDERDRQEDEDRSAHARRVSGTQGRA